MSNLARLTNLKVNDTMPSMVYQLTYEDEGNAYYLSFKEKYNNDVIILRSTI